MSQSSSMALYWRWDLSLSLGLADGLALLVQGAPRIRLSLPNPQPWVCRGHHGPAFPWVLRTQSQVLRALFSVHQNAVLGLLETL